MTRIAIVEDEEKYYHILKEYIQKYAGENSEEIEAVWFQNGVEFLEKFHSDFDILLLDIEMPEKDGMSLAASLRRHLHLSLIIFITSHTQYAVKAYELSVFRYIPKSEMETCLPLALKDASCILKQSSSDAYIIESARRIQKLSAEDIIYVYK